MCASCSVKQTEIFYDGNGEVIPVEAVRLLVQSQFVVMDAPEWDTINKYFYVQYEEGSYLDQFHKLQALEPTWDSLAIDKAIQED